MSLSSEVISNSPLSVLKQEGEAPQDLRLPRCLLAHFLYEHHERQRRRQKQAQGAGALSLLVYARLLFSEEDLKTLDP
jgi:hypothetical protein